MASFPLLQEDILLYSSIVGQFSILSKKISFLSSRGCMDHVSFYFGKDPHSLIKLLPSNQGNIPLSNSKEQSSLNPVRQFLIFLEDTILSYISSHASPSTRMIASLHTWPNPEGHPLLIKLFSSTSIIRRYYQAHRSV